MDKETFYNQFKNELEIILEKDLDSLRSTDSLLDLGLDSLNLVHLIVYIEELLEIELPIEEYSFNNFSTLDNIYCEIIQKYTSVL